MIDPFEPEYRLKGFMGKRSGMALLVVLVLIVMLSLSAYGFTLLMQNQYRLSRIQEDQVQAKLTAQSGIDWVAALLSQTVNSRREHGDLDDNQELFQDIRIDASSSTQPGPIAGWSFSVLNVSNSDETSLFSNTRGAVADGTGSTKFTFGLQSESAKVHLPTLAKWDLTQPGHARRVLESLPGATKQVVDLWLERLAAGNHRPIGNPQIQSLWLGKDLNCNYQLDPIEVALQSMSASERPNLEPVAATFGWRQYLTWVNGERNETASGQKRVFLNSSNLQELHRSLTQRWPEEWADFVIALRQFGPSFQSSLQRRATPRSSLAPTESQWTGYQPDFSVAPSYTIGSPLELIGVTVQLPSGFGNVQGTSGNRQLNSPLRDEIQSASDYLNRLLDDVTTEPTSSRSGRIDVNQAPYWVLMAVPGMERELAERIVQHRQSWRGGGNFNADSSIRSTNDTTIAWLYEQGLVDLPRLIQLEPYLTARSDVYSCQVIGYQDEQHTIYRATVTIDARLPKPIIRDFRTWHDWDRGFDIQLLRSVASQQVRSNAVD